MSAAYLTAHAQKKWASRLEVILKLTERCNIDCTYCYVFRGADISSMSRPARLSRKTVNAVADFLEASCRDFHVEALQIDFHGGEPLALGKQQFGEACEVLRMRLDPLTDFSLAIQTNATLVDAEWINLFAKHRVCVGVSLDGPRSINDRHRLDFQGRSTYDRTRRGLDALREAYDCGLLPSLGVLAVIDPATSPREIYQHLVRDIGIRTLDFLLPDFTHDSMPEPDNGDVGRFLCGAFDAWVEDDDPDVFVRILSSITSLLLGGRSHMIGFGGELQSAISIASDGTLGPDDTLRSCGTDFFYSKLKVDDSSLVQLLKTPLLEEVTTAGYTQPSNCASCGWSQICHGGQLVHRFSKAERFARQSVYCTSLKIIYEHIARFLIASGELSVEDFQRTLEKPS